MGSALGDFFTVVEFPVLGYLPPAILTEMHFQLDHSALQLAPPHVFPSKAALCIGRMMVSCSLLDTTQDASVTVAVEDAALYLSKNGGHGVTDCICVADVDYVDLSVTLSEPESDPAKVKVEESKVEPTLFVDASVNLLRVRTCADTIQLITNISSGLVEQTPNAPET